MDKSSVMVVCVSAARETIHGKMYMRPFFITTSILFLSMTKRKKQIQGKKFFHTVVCY